MAKRHFISGAVAVALLKSGGVVFDRAGLSYQLVDGRMYVDGKLSQTPDSPGWLDPNLWEHPAVRAEAELGIHGS